VQDGARGDVELACGLFVGHLPTTEDETLLWRGNTRLFLYFLFDSGDLVIEIDIKFNLFACEGLYFDEHCVDATMGLVISGDGRKRVGEFRVCIMPCYTIVRS